MFASMMLVTHAVIGASPEGLERFEFSRAAFGTQVRVVVHAPDEGRAVEAVRAAFGRIEQLDWALSDWREDGALGRLAREAGGERVELPRDLARCLMAAMPVAVLSKGAFDPTAAPLTHLWRQAREEGSWPSPEAVAAARGLVGHGGLELHARLDLGHVRREGKPAGDGSGGTSPTDPADSASGRLARPGMSLDLGGVAKGYAADELLAVLVEHGLERSLVDIGGDLALGAPPPDAAGWRVRAGHGPGARELELAHVGVATSGPQEQHLDRHGRRWSHLIDPRTGYGVSDGRTLTAIAPRAALADALASAAAVLSPAEAEALAARFEGVRLIQQHRDGRTLFDGASLDGWSVWPAGSDWRVEQRTLVGRGGWLVSEPAFSAFELELVYRVEGEAQLVVAARIDAAGQQTPPPDWSGPGSPAGLGGLHLWLGPADPAAGRAPMPTEPVSWLRLDPGGDGQAASGTQRHLRLSVTGFDPQLRVWIDDRERGAAHLGPGIGPALPHGPIAFGLLGEGAVHIEQVRLRELPVFGEAFAASRPRDPEAFAPGHRELSEAGIHAGWQELAPEGLEDFEAHGDADGYGWERGLLTIPSRGWGHLATRRDYRDFELSLEFELAPGANSGLFLRAARDGSNPATSGAEIQLIDDEGWERFTGHALTPTQRTGALYAAVGTAAPPAKRLQPPGAWNRLEVLYSGQRLAVALEGVVLYDLDTHTLAAEPPFAERAPTGFLGFQRYGAPAVPEEQSSVRLQNLFVRPLAAGAPETESSIPD
jgi:FAD:protein FMN transferase